LEFLIKILPKYGSFSGLSCSPFSNQGQKVNAIMIVICVLSTASSTLRFKHVAIEGATYHHITSKRACYYTH